MLEFDRKNVFRPRILCSICYFKNVTENVRIRFDRNQDFWKIVHVFLLHSLLKSCPYRHCPTRFEFASRFSNSPEKSVFRLRILCDIYYFKNATENDSVGFDKNQEFWKSCMFFYCILFWNLAHIDTFRPIFNSRVDFRIRRKKMCFGYEFRATFIIISRTSQKTTLPHSTPSTNRKVESQEEMCRPCGFCVAFAVSRMSRKPHLSEMQKIQKSEKSC